MGIRKAGLISKEYTGNTTLPKQGNRSYFFIVMTQGTCTLEFGKGGGTIPLSEGNFYEPIIVPTSQIDVVSTGTYTIVTN